MWLVVFANSCQSTILHNFVFSIVSQNLKTISIESISSIIYGFCESISQYLILSSMFYQKNNKKEKKQESQIVNAKWQIRYKYRISEQRWKQVVWKVVIGDNMDHIQWNISFVLRKACYVEETYVY